MLLSVKLNAYRYALLINIVYYAAFERFSLIFAKILQKYFINLHTLVNHFVTKKEVSPIFAKILPQNDRKNISNFSFEDIRKTLVFKYFLTVHFLIFSFRFLQCFLSVCTTFGHFFNFFLY